MTETLKSLSISRAAFVRMVDALRIVCRGQQASHHKKIPCMYLHNYTDHKDIYIVFLSCQTKSL